MIKITKNCLKLGGRLCHEFEFFGKNFCIDFLNTLNMKLAMARIPLINRLFEFLTVALTVRGVDRPEVSISPFSKSMKWECFIYFNFFLTGTAICVLTDSHAFLHLCHYRYAGKLSASSLHTHWAIIDSWF